METYATLDEALSDIAKRSFNKDATVTPTENGFTVETDYFFNGDDAVWTYENGISFTCRVDDFSGLMELYEPLNNEHQIRNYLPIAVAHLEAGNPVHFAYLAVADGDIENWDEYGNALDENGEVTEYLAGWTLAAITLEREDS